MTDLVNSLSAQIAKVYANLTADNNSANVVDTQGGGNVVAFIIFLHAVGTADATNYFTVKVEESDDNTFATGVTVVTDDANRIIGTQPVINDTALAASLKKFGVAVGTKRYMRLVFDETLTADITVSAIALVGAQRHSPVA
jgi:hypothetical protein